MKKNILAFLVSIGLSSSILANVKAFSPLPDNMCLAKVECVAVKPGANVSYCAEEKISLKIKSGSYFFKSASSYSNTKFTLLQCNYDTGKQEELTLGYKGYYPKGADLKNYPTKDLKNWKPEKIDGNKGYLCTAKTPSDCLVEKL